VHPVSWPTGDPQAPKERSRRRLCFDIYANFAGLFIPGSYRELAEELPESLSLLARNWSILDNVLETLDMQQHSLGVLYVLLAKLHSASTANPEPVQLIQLMRDFVQRNTVEQLRFAVCACGFQSYLSNEHPQINSVLCSVRSL